MILVLVALYGALAYSLYSVAVAHANDHAGAGDFVKLSGGLLLLYGVGTIIGPLFGARAMDLFGPVGLFAVTALAQASIGAYAMMRSFKRPPVPIGLRRPFPFDTFRTVIDAWNSCGLIRDRIIWTDFGLHGQMNGSSRALTVQASEKWCSCKCRAISGNQPAWQLTVVQLLLGQLQLDAAVLGATSVVSPGSSGWNSPKPAATSRLAGTPFSIRNLTTEVARAEDSSQLSR